jgi:hypothetical protein
VLGSQHNIALALLDPSLRGLTQQLWALQAAAAAAAKASEFAKSKRQLEIDLQKALGNDSIALEMEHADLIAELTAKWGDQAGELIAIYQQIWAAQDQVASSGSDWVKTLQDWLRNLQLDSTLSPLTPNQRFDVAHNQYVEDLLKAQAGDKDARGRFTNDADAYLREALAMFGRGSFQYEAIFRAINEQTQGLINQGFGPSAPVTLTDVNATFQGAAQTAKQQMDALLAKIDVLTARTEQQTQEVRRGVDNADQNHEDAREQAEALAREQNRTLTNAASTANQAPMSA